MKSVAALLALLFLCGIADAKPKRPARDETVETSPEGIPAGQPERLPAGDENATDAESAPQPQPVEPAASAAPMGDPGELPLKATRWRVRRGAPASGARAKAAAHAPVGDATAALRPPDETPDANGIYKAPGTRVSISGDATNPLGGDVAEIVGHAKLVRRGMVLSSDRLKFHQKKGEFIATGNVVVADPHYTLSCGRLQFYSVQEMGVAWESPKITEEHRGADGEIADRMEMTAFQISIYSTEERVEGLERVRIYRMIRRDGKLALDFKITADSCDSHMVNHESVFKGQVKVESPTYTIECKRLIFDQTADKMTCIGDAHVIGFGPKGEVTSTVEGNKIVHLVREHRSIVIGGVTANLQPGKPSGARELDAAAVKETSPSEEILQLPEAPKDPEKDKYRRKK